jgi:hypothetical protein
MPELFHSGLREVNSQSGVSNPQDATQNLTMQQPSDHDFKNKKPENKSQTIKTGNFLNKKKKRRTKLF